MQQAETQFSPESDLPEEKKESACVLKRKQTIDALADIFHKFSRETSKEYVSDGFVNSEDTTPTLQHETSRIPTPLQSETSLPLQNPPELEEKEKKETENPALATIKIDNYKA